MLKQEKQIQQFLITRLGQEDAKAIFQGQNMILEKIYAKTEGRSNSQRKTLKETILPRVALYQALRNHPMYHTRAMELVQSYMFDVVARKKHNSMLHMEKIPGFYWLYSHVFLNIMKKTDLQKSLLHAEKDSYDVTITECLWHTACVENGCQELCSCFCKVDDITYGDLNKIGFSRTQTLGYGGKCCDFHFYKV